jgi:hypothetical protein
MLSGILATKVTLQHLLYPAGGNPNYQSLQNTNPVPSGTNYIPSMPNTIIDTGNGIKPQNEVPDYDPGLNGKSDNF